MASYSKYNFVIKATDNNTKLNIRNIQGLVKWTVNIFDIVATYVSNNFVVIKTSSNNNEIVLDFSSFLEAKEALKILQAQVEICRKNIPTDIPEEIANYIGTTGGYQGWQGFQGIGNIGI